MRTKSFHIALAMTLLLPGCAAIALNGGQEVKFGSDPLGATVQFRGQKCVTPCGLTVPRGGIPEEVGFSMEGREPYYAEIASGNPGGVPRTDSGASKGLIATAAVIDAIIFPVGIINVMGVTVRRLAKRD